jgi:uncharacterized protein YutE (UPF0331/DUF86 family)
VRAAGFRNVVVHAYATLDMARVHDAATHGPADLRAFLARLVDRIPPDAQPAVAWALEGGLINRRG